MISLDISLSEEQLRNVKESLLHIPKAANKAIARAINRAVEGARTDAIKAICSEYAIKPTDVRKKIHIVRAKPDNLKAEVIFSGGPSPLMNFYVRPKVPPSQLGIKVRDRERIEVAIKTGAPKLWSHAFVARMHNISSSTDDRYVGVFYRTGRIFSKAKALRQGSSRTEIKAVYSLSVPEMAGKEEVLDFIEKRAHERLDKELKHQINYLFRGGK
jgi:hypothetical protein